MSEGKASHTYPQYGDSKLIEGSLKLSDQHESLLTTNLREYEIAQGTHDLGLDRSAGIKPYSIHY